MKNILIAMLVFLCSFSTSALCADDSNNNNLDFDNVLLIINYNHPYYQSIPFLREIYSPVFPNIIFYGEKSHPDVIDFSHYYGWYGHNIIADAMEKYPDFEGYLCIQDDCWMNFWNYSRFDKTKIWFAPLAKIHPINEKESAWSWWIGPCGRSSILEAFNKIPAKYKAVHEGNIGIDKVSWSFHDFVYIPGKFREDFIALNNCFVSPPTFVELALPNILLCLDDLQNWERTSFNWRIIDIEREFTPSLDWLHPIKFSKIENRIFVKEQLDKYYLR